MLPLIALLLFFYQEKLKRLIRFLNFKELKNKSQKQTSQDDDEVLEATGKLLGLWTFLNMLVNLMYDPSCLLIIIIIIIIVLVDVHFSSPFQRSTAEMMRMISISS